jgi:hypothetical protein
MTDANDVMAALVYPNDGCLDLAKSKHVEINVNGDFSVESMFRRSNTFSS